LLGQLNDQQLSDLGISHAERLNEVDKTVLALISSLGRQGLF
jgi:uncharacterized protein YjiS (DUF1127 family)